MTDKMDSPKASNHLTRAKWAFGSMMESRNQKAVFAALCLVCLIGLHNFLDKDEEMPIETNQSFNKVERDIVTYNNSEQPVQLQHCQCKRVPPVLTPNQTHPESGKRIIYPETTCGRDAYARGNGQKVVAFSFYGDINTDHAKRKGYFQGIAENLALMPKFYPGWIMRVYFDLDPKDEILEDLCKLSCDNPILDICHAGKLPGTPMKDARRVFAMNWRFFPTLDPQVNLFVSRDLDSRFSARELSAVHEWLADHDNNFVKKNHFAATNLQPFHAMRDHPKHGVPFLGSSWGTRFDLSGVKVTLDGKVMGVREAWKESWRKGFEDKLLWAKRDDYGPDQTFLRRYIWRWARHGTLQHDSYTCKFFSGSIGFPTKRRMEPNNFVSAVVKQAFPLEMICPKKCRREGHKDWKYC